MATKGKVREILKIIHADEWVQIKANSGDHRQFKHPIKRGRVTVDGSPSMELPPKTWDSILKQAGLK